MARIQRARPAAWQWVAAAGIAAVLVLSVGGYRWEEYRKGQQAKQQVMLAMRVTAEKLAVAERKVNELNHRRIGYE
jgi:transposase